MNFLKYLTLSEEDEKVGLNVLHGGYNIIKPHEEYPYSKHPNAYLFQWKYGRILDEFQLIYIISGEGIFESSSVKQQKVEAGTIMLLCPNEWHRYKPVKHTGWHEYWFGFDGRIAQRWLKNGVIQKDKVLLQIGYNEQVFQLYKTLIDHIKREKPGYQAIVGGLTMQILGLASSLVKERQFSGKETEEMVQKARLLLMEGDGKPISPADVAAQLDIGYSRFRKVFKEYTGMPPGQFQMQYRIIKARELLAQPSITIKQIAFDLGFDSDHHFSRIFKSKTGQPPGAYRKRAMGKFADR